MNSITVYVSALLLSASTASAINLKRATVEVSATGQAYDYSHHGQDWIQGVCSSRERQSPINFPDLTAPVSGKLSYSYQPVQSSFELANNGHTLAADLMGLGYGGITYENSWYNLMTVNFHSESEHTFAGMHMPLEVHLVHKKYDSDALLIVAVPFTVPAFGPAAAPGMAPAPAPAVLMQAAANATVGTGMNIAQMPMAPAPAPGPAGFGFPGAPYVVPIPDPTSPGSLQLQKFVTMPPPIVNQKATAVVDETDPLDLNLLMAGGQFFEYAGSLTAPPCAEVVTWFVRRNPIMAHPTQVAAIRNSVF